jgi:adenosylmethionine-8-amino-7-oxononanoate aminotransferase
MHSPIWRPFTIQLPEKEYLNVVRGEGIYLYLENGRKLMDMISSWWVNIHGHARVEIAQAISAQAYQLEQVIFADFSHEPAEHLARNLMEITHNNFHKVFFSDNGSTAVEVSLKLAHQYWKNKDSLNRNEVIAFEGAYHGDTLGAMSTSGESIFTNIFDELLFNVTRLPFPSTWENDDQVELKEEIVLARLRSQLEEHPSRYAAIILEPLIQGAGGMNMCRPIFIERICNIVREYEILVIFDEILTGFGRTGSLFAYQQTSIIPDIMTLSKGITGGFLPLSVTMMNKNVYDQFNTSDPVKTFWHGHSYTANPLGCAAANASLKILLENVDPVYSKLESWHKQYSIELTSIIGVAKYRVCGTIAAFNIETDQESGYLNKIGLKIKEEALKRGIYLRPLGDTVYLMPPYCITKQELEHVYIQLSDIVSRI